MSTTMSTPQATILNVEGMTCPSCIRHVSAALHELDGVGAVQVELRAGTVRVEHDAAAAPIERLIDALRDAGYESRPRAA
jgi:copper chaperone